MIDHTQFLFHSEMKYPPVIQKGEYNSPGFNQVLTNNVEAGATFKGWIVQDIGGEPCVQPTTGIYIKSNRDLVFSDFADTVIWRVYGY